MATKQDIIRELIRQGVPMAIKTEYVDGVPSRSYPLLCTLTKKDRFYRLNGKIVSKGWAQEAARIGLVA